MSLWCWLENGLYSDHIFMAIPVAVSFSCFPIQQNCFIKYAGLLLKPFLALCG